MCKVTPQLLSLNLCFHGNRNCRHLLGYHRRTYWAEIQSLSSVDPVSTPQKCLLRKNTSIAPAVCLKAVADVLLLLHVHIVHLVNWDRIGRTRNAGREGARWSQGRALARALRWVHVSCVRTKRHIWLAVSPLFGSILDGALSGLSSAGNPR